MRTVDGTSIETIRRLPAYHSIAPKLNLKELSMSALIASHQYRSHYCPQGPEQAGIEGKPKLGYETVAIINEIAEFLGWKRRDRDPGRMRALGSALLGYSDSKNVDMTCCRFDINPEIIGTQIHGKDILPLDKMVNLCRRMHITGIIAVPASLRNQ